MGTAMGTFFYQKTGQSCQMANFPFFNKTSGSTDFTIALKQKRPYITVKSF
jgi:hypothetical protein